MELEIIVFCYKNLHPMTRENTNKAGQCKLCKKDYDKEYHQANLARHKAQQKARYDSLTHEQRISEKARLDKWRRDNLGIARERNKEWRLNHPEEVKASRDKFYSANRAKMTIYNRDWHRNNPARSKKIRDKYLKKSPHVHKDIGLRRRALKMGAIVAKVDLRKVPERDNFICQLCRKKVDMALKWPHRMSPSIDHIVPLSKGGAHELRNLQLAHLACNTAKGIKSLREQLRLF